ncbi:MAG: Asp-tRNA(Asn)/Glu-tRNA(Gln) amidotransferase subunit GatB [Patescibacteria group bacterium]
MKYIPTIGLEIHAELKTRTKMFCDSANNPDEERPNVNICPVCMAHPGTLPVINKKAVEHVLRVGKAVGGTIADFTEFDRKNYFYPDIPKGYQISQYKYPLVSGGKLAGVDITRVHLEEDTATSKHDKGDYSLVDYNRAGVPLMELVTEPVIHDAETAVWFAKELQLLLRYLGVSDANMEKGEMRVEANISISLKSNAESQKLGTKVEVKNLNSFKVVGKAIEYEIARQIKALETGEKLVQETRGWDENRGATFSQRKKESSDDYRYFPDPDLPKLRISEIAKFQDITLPELPRQKRERYARDYGIKAEDIESYVTDEKLGVFFELIAMSLKEKDLVVLASNYITSDLLGMRSAGTDIFAYITAEQFVALISMAGAGEISSRAAKDILGILVEKGGDPREIARREGLFQKSDEGELKAIAEKIIAENEKVVTEYKAGKEASLQFLVGQVMKETRGSANPQVAAKLLKEVLS